MKNSIFLLLLSCLITATSFSQNLTQVVRGTVLDTDSKLPLIGANITLLESNPFLGTTTDINGQFRLENVPIGRISIQLSYLGYEDQTIQNIVVNSGKEVVLNLNMQESVAQMKEVIVSAYSNKGEARNDMALLSARSISAEETNRYAGGFNDPSRIMSNFAGVTNTQDGSNDIIVRGNSPKYMQWRLEGMQITNPNHFADQSSVGGAVSALNNNLLATSDFYSGAFSAEYGDVLSGVYDVKLRAGNNEKFEPVFGFGLLGTELTLEGPFKKGYSGSYLVNYRYSTASLLDVLGLLGDVPGVPNFQDAAFKVVLPSSKMGTFSIFGLGGLSNFLFEDVTPAIWVTPGDNAMRGEIIEDFKKEAFLLNSGLTHTINLSPKSYLKSTLSYSNEGADDNIFELRTFKIYDDEGEFLRDSILDKKLNYQGSYQKASYRGAMTYNNKINAKHKIQLGIAYRNTVLRNQQSQLLEDGSTRFFLVDFNEHIANLQSFVNWKFRLNESITLLSGVHNMNVLLNNKHTLEPRVALNWKLNKTSSINAGYGLHSTMESIHNYYAQIEQPDGSITTPNTNLGLLKAHHFVVGYEQRFGKHFRAKLEAYYQGLYDIPVENNDTSYYSTINEGLEFRYVDLVNQGTGKNYGLELTLERFFHNNYYFLINASVFQSKYKSLEGIERNTQYNGNYLINLLAGKEFEGLGKKKNQTLSLNAKVFVGGGKKIIPLLRDDQGNVSVDPSTNNFWDYEKAYENDIEDIYQVTLSASYKFNRPKATHELFLNLDNLTNTKGKSGEFYDEGEPNSIGYIQQFGLFPNLMYRVYF